MTPNPLVISFVFLALCSRTFVLSYSFVNTSNRNVIEQSICHAKPNFPTTIIHSPHDTDLLTMRVSKGRNKPTKADTLGYINQKRRHLAGKPGSKYYMDPNKVFVGNLPYDTTEEDMEEFFRKELGGLDNVESMKIIFDYQTRKSKGYGFIQFMDPIFATYAMVHIKGKKLKGRVIQLNQGRKKNDLEDRKLFVKKRTRDKSALDDEALVIDKALDQVEEVECQQREDVVYTSGDFDDGDDDALFDDDSDDEDGVDGIFEEFYERSKWEQLDDEIMKKLNRDQRREAQRRKPRQKLPHKGFE